MDQLNLNPIFQVTDPNHGKSDVEILQERIRAAQQQNLASQMQRANELQSKLDKTPAKQFNKGGAIAAALADIVAPQTGTFNKFMAINQATPDRRKQIADELARTQAGIGSSANALSAGMRQSGSLDRQKELAQFRADLQAKNQASNFDQAKQLAEFKSGLRKGGIGSLTKGQEAVDKKFAKDYVDWTTGGSSNTYTNLETLEGVLGDLSQGPEIGGNVMPQAVRKYSEPEVVATEQKVERIAFESLKKILGGAFSEKEGQRLVEQSYDPRLSNAQNMEKVQNTYKTLQAMADDKERAVKHFEEFGSLKGFKGYKENTSMDKYLKDLKKEYLSPKRESTPMERPAASVDYDAMSDEELKAAYEAKMKAGN